MRTDERAIETETVETERESTGSTPLFADQQKELESALDREGKLSTEELRLALRRYRSFFDRLLSM